MRGLKDMNSQLIEENKLLRNKVRYYEYLQQENWIEKKSRSRSKSSKKISIVEA